MQVSLKSLTVQKEIICLAKSGTAVMKIQININCPEDVVMQITFLFLPKQQDSILENVLYVVCHLLTILCKIRKEIITFKSKEISF